MTGNLGPKLESPARCDPVILIIAHRAELTAPERASLFQCFKILGHFPIRVVCPRGLDVSAYRRVVPWIEFDFIDPKWQRTYAAFNRLKILPFLYRRYRRFGFVLFYELDAFVFRDELETWCRRGFDYIGAPWLTETSDLESAEVGVGNGGFSLRRVEAMLRVTRTLRWIQPPTRPAEKYWQKKRWLRAALSVAVHATIRNNTFFLMNDWSQHEDLFRGLAVPKLFPWFRVAPPREAARFSFEEQPRRLFAETGQQLPFGCHAWARYDPDFWRFHIPSESSPS